MGKIQDLWRKTPAKGKKIISVAALVLALSIPMAKCGAQVSEPVYLVDLEDKFQHEAVLTDKEGEEITIDSEDRDQIVAIVGTEKTKKGRDYPVVLVNEDGKYIRGYMDGKYLDDDAIDSVEVRHDVFDETSVVIPEAGLWLRDNDNKEIDHNTEDAYLLPHGATVMSSSVYETSRDNSYKWKEAVYYNRGENQLERGYLVGDYVYSTDFDQIKGKRFIVSNTNGVNLKLRKSASTDSEKIGEFPEGTEVVLIPGIASISDGDYDWFYVVAKTEDGVVSGYMAATWYKGEETIHYLTETTPESELSKFDKLPGKRFIISNTNGEMLKLRVKADTKSEIIGKFAEGTEVVLMPNTDSVSDGDYDWFIVAVETEDGIKYGYMAATWYRGDLPDIHYLVEKNNTVQQKPEVENLGEMIMKVVDTRRANYNPLKLRTAASIDADIISELENDTVVYTYEKYERETVNADGYTWIKVALTNGDTGYVASEYLKDRSLSEQTDLSEQADTIDFGSEGKVEGYYGVDVKNTTDYNEFEKLLTGKIDFATDYSVNRNLSAMEKPEFVMFKIGGSYTGRNYENVHLVDNVYSQLDNLKNLTSLCEKYEIPYGFYFYSQATSVEDVKVETDFVEYALDKVGGSTYNILPTVYDVEEYIYHNNQSIPTRAKEFADKYGREALTELANLWMNTVRENCGTDVVVYAAHSCFSNMLKYDKLDPLNQQDVWAVSPSSSHSDALTSKHPDVVDNIAMRQIALDPSNKNIVWDVDFINKEYLENLLIQHGLLESRGRGLSQ